jgi:predicted RNase H-like HicB family nuclease
MDGDYYLEFTEKEETVWLMVLKIHEMTYTAKRDTLEEIKQLAKENIDYWKEHGVEYPFKPEFYEVVRREEEEEKFSYA